MSASRLFAFLGPSLFRNSSRLCRSRPLNSGVVCISSSIRLNCYSSSAVVLDSGASTPSQGETFSVSAHPWPEWVNFVDRLKTKGYLTPKGGGLEKGVAGDAVDDDSVDDDAGVYRDMKLVKEACLSFARDRFDIFNSLSKDDIEKVVEKGCPNLFRKSVNSAKRLRAYVELEEGDVCSSCTLRGSCDRAYVILEGSEAVARTVDIVRILVLYALDPQFISGENKLPGGELIEMSARNLLSQLIELDETPPDPELPKPAFVAFPRKKQSVGLLDEKSSKVVDMKDGDWVCTNCNFMNFARNVRCMKCKVGGPDRVPIGRVEMKKGDWNCPQCSFMNFASNRKCFRCEEPRPQRDLKPGDWECPKCDFWNYSKNMFCKKCNLDRPSHPGLQEDRQTWRKPY